MPKKTDLLDTSTAYRLTYRYLRWVMVAALVTLLLSVIMQSVLYCGLGSVSAYYYTPVRTVFVGSLIAFGSALIAYQGRARVEDVALNFSGYMAIVVALVPTRQSVACRDSGFGQSDEAIAGAVRNNISALIGTTLLVVGLKLWLRHRDRRGKNADRDVEKAQLKKQPWSVWDVLAYVVGGAILVRELLQFLIQPDGFIDSAHGTAAITMVFGLGCVMFFNALAVPHEEAVLGRGSRFWNSFRFWYIALVVLLIVLVALVLTAPNERVILILELVVFAVFVAYWILQSVELWGRSTDGQPSGPAGQAAKSAGDRPKGPSPAGAEATEHAGPVPVLEEATE
jgi:hypothetical protein